MSSPKVWCASCNHSWLIEDLENLKYLRKANVESSLGLIKTTIYCFRCFLCNKWAWTLDHHLGNGSLGVTPASWNAVLTELGEKSAPFLVDADGLTLDVLGNVERELGHVELALIAGTLKFEQDKK